MKNRLIFYFFIFSIGILNSCLKENNEETDALESNRLKTSFLENDQLNISKDLSQLINDQGINSFQGIDNKRVIDSLITRINNKEGIFAKLLCYNSMITKPNISEILLRVDSSGTEVNRILELNSEVNKQISFKNIYSYSKDYNISLVDTSCYSCLMSKLSDTTDYLIQDFVKPEYRLNLDGDSLEITMKYSFLCGSLHDSVVIENKKVQWFIENKRSELNGLSCDLKGSLMLNIKLISDTTSVEIYSKFIYDNGFRSQDKSVFILNR